MTSDPLVADATVDDMNPIINCKGGCGGGGGGGGGGVDAGPSGTFGAIGPFSYGTQAEGYSPAGVKTFCDFEYVNFLQGSMAGKLATIIAVGHGKHDDAKRHFASDARQCGHMKCMSIGLACTVPPRPVPDGTTQVHVNLQPFG